MVDGRGPCLGFESRIYEQARHGYIRTVTPFYDNRTPVRAGGFGEI